MPLARPGGACRRTRTPFSVARISKTTGWEACPNQEAIWLRILGYELGANCNSHVSHSLEHNGQCVASCSYPHWGQVIEFAIFVENMLFLYVAISES